MSEQLSLPIEGLTLKGYGQATLPSGQKIEIAHTLPGDEVSVEWKKKRHAPQKGRLLELLIQSSQRVEPACPHVGVCGGCCWQQMAYEEQLKVKEERVRKAFGRDVLPILRSPETFRYRNKMEFSFSENRGGMRYLGLMIAQAEPYVFNVSECHLCPAWFTQVLSSVRAWWEASGVKSYYPPADRGSLRYLTLRRAVRGGGKMAILNVSGNPEFALKREEIDSFTKAVQDAVGGEEISVFLRIHQTKKGKPTQFYEMHLAGPDHMMEEIRLKERTLQFKISPASFFQPNTLSAEVLYDAALSFLQPSSVVYDLYCGTGSLGMAAAGKADRVIGIEMSPEAVLDAEANLKRNQIPNMKLYQGDVGKVLSELMATPHFLAADTVIVDPPRAGLDPLAMQNLKTLLPKSILYISCNPLTQAENVKELLSAGYRIEALQPVDQFPHTYHIENIAFLTRP